VDKNGGEVMATPKENLKVSKRILDEHKDPVAIYKVKYLLAKALEQQEKAHTSERLGSDPKACMSNAHKEIPEAKLDRHSQTGTTKCQRIDAKNWKDPIPIFSGSTKD
jgi:hypothetical protein